MKNLCFLVAPFSKNKLLTFGIFNESNIWAKVYHIWEMEVQGSTIVEITGRRSCYFIEYRLDQLNSKHTKIAVNSAIQYFEGCSQKKMSAKSFKLFGPPTTKWWSCKVFAKLNGNHLLMANIFKLHKYQVFGLMEMHNMCKI